MNKLDAAGIYQESEVDGLVADYLKYAKQPHKGLKALYKWVTPPGTVSETANVTPLTTATSSPSTSCKCSARMPGTFIRQYDFLSQIVNYESVSLEKLSIYLRHLAPVISSEQLNHEIAACRRSRRHLRQIRRPPCSVRSGRASTAARGGHRGFGNARERAHRGSRRLRRRQECCRS